ncbi:MAG TPA: radical SAM protein [Anaerolineales bacterium]|nr:radical SAM protein [Anaerolineales bacterium]
MIQTIQVKTILNAVKQPDTWFGLRYNMNLYRGCQHQCIYCDSRSACYQIENFADILVKENAIDLLEKELPRKRVKGTVGTGSMNDPYMPVEEKFNLTGRALRVIAQNHFPVHVITKSALVLKDLETLREINQVYAAVSFSITTADDGLAKKLEPAASLPSERLRAMRTLAENGILTGVTMMPILPFLEDSEENITEIVRQAHAHGATYILPGFGVTLRDQQRDYFYAKLDRHFPGVRARYERQFGEKYFAPARNAWHLEKKFQELCQELGICTHMPLYEGEKTKQMTLF